MLLMVEKGIKSGIHYGIHRYAKASNNYTKNYDKNKESSYLTYWGGDILYGCAMPQKLPIGGFKWFENTSQFIEDFIKNCNQDNNKDIYLKLKFTILKN